MGHSDKLIRTTALVTAVIILSKVFGLARDVITAGYFGTGLENDAYASAYSLFYIPVLLFNSCISATLVPLFVRERERHSLKRANRFAGNVLSIFIIVALAIAALMAAFCTPLVKLIFHFPPEGIALTVRLTRIMLLGLAFNIASIVLASVLNAQEHFMAAQLTGFPLSIAVVLAILLLSPSRGIESIAWGVLAASILQVVVLLPSLFGWFKFKPSLKLRDKRFLRMLHLAGPAMLSMGVSEINHMIDRSLASSLPAGSISAMNYAYKLITFLLGILMVPLTTIMFSRLSKLAVAKDRPGMLAALRRSIALICLVAAPIVIIGMVMSEDVVRLIYMRGSFREDSVLVTGSVLLFYLIGVLSFGLRDFMNRCFHAIEDTKTPFRISVLVVVLNIVLNLILRSLMGARGLALATSISSYCGLLTLLWLLRRRMGRLGLKKIAPELIKIALSAIVCALVCVLMAKIMPDTSSTLDTLLRLVVVTAAAGISYLAMGLLLGIGTLRTALRTVKNKLHR